MACNMSILLRRNLLALLRFTCVLALEFFFFACAEKVAVVGVNHERLLLLFALDVLFTPRACAHARS
jgi:hypothetical protein